MLTAQARGVFSSSWHVSSGQEEVATLKPSAWREKAEVFLPGSDAPFVLLREGLVSGEFQLRQGENVVVRARKPSAWRSAFALEFGGHAVQLKPDSCFHSAFTLYRGETVVGHIRRQGLLQRRATLELPADWPLPLQMFTFWLVVLVWNRDSAAASS